MKISLEAETLPLFITGIVLVLLAEFILSLLCLRNRPDTRRAMLGRMFCLAVSFSCLGAMLFWRRFTPDGDVFDSSVLFALFGIFWVLSECLAVSAFLRGNTQNSRAVD